MSLTCDKAQVGGLGLLAGAFCCPDGHAALSVIQALRRGKIHRIMSVSRAKTHRSRTPKLLVYSFCWCIVFSWFVLVFRIHQSFGTRTLFWCIVFVWVFRIHQSFGRIWFLCRRGQRLQILAPFSSVPPQTPTTEAAGTYQGELFETNEQACTCAYCCRLANRLQEGNATNMGKYLHMWDTFRVLLLSGLV
jgi:hypothetical protein